LGRHAMVSACSKLVQDVPPFMLADGSPAEVRSINKVGLERAGFATEQIESVRSAFKVLYRKELNRTQAISHLQENTAGSNQDLITELIAFLLVKGRGLA
jgi:UDP-N-acetylglucosamine acyltransferase